MKSKGIMPALITPLNEDGKTVNEESARGLIEYLINQGADGFYVLGSTGEGLVLDESERMKMLEISVDQVKGRKPIICHTAAMNFSEAVRLSKHAEKVGADALSAIPPIFFHYRDEDIYNYYKSLAGSTNLPFVMYNHPSANGGMSAETVAKIFEIDNITGVKWTVNNYYEMMRLKDITNGEINIINGPDEMLISGLAAGADAGIGTTYNVMLPQYLKIYKYFTEGNVEEARKIQYKVNRVIKCMAKNEVISAVKSMCSLLGFPAGEATYPLRNMQGDGISKLQSELSELGWPFIED
jgi:N-acetylneuraminate lyase